MSRGITIRTTLFALLTVLVVIAVGLSVNRALNDWHQRSGAAVAVEANVTSDHLLDAAAQWARERGFTAVALSGAPAASRETLDSIAKARAAGDKAFAQGMARMKAGQAFKDKDRMVSAAEAAQAKLAAYRQGVDGALGKPQAERPAEVAKGWVPTITAAIEQIKTVRMAADFANDSAEATQVAYTHIKHNLWIITEFAGRQRALIGGEIAAKRQMSPRCSATSAASAADSSRRSRWSTR